MLLLFLLQLNFLHLHFNYKDFFFYGAVVYIVTIVSLFLLFFLLIIVTINMSQVLLHVNLKIQPGSRPRG